MWPSARLLLAYFAALDAGSADDCLSGVAGRRVAGSTEGFAVSKPVAHRRAAARSRLHI